MKKWEIIYFSLYCHHQNDFCIKMGSDESHFNVLLIVRRGTKSQDSVHRQPSQPNTGHHIDACLFMRVKNEHNKNI